MAPYALMYQLKNNNVATQPALVTGSAVATVAGVLAVVSIFIPIPDGVTQAILVVAAFLLPIITSLFTKGKVWSPASVQEVVNESVKQALEAAGKENVNPTLKTDPGTNEF